MTQIPSTTATQVISCGLNGSAGLSSNCSSTFNQTATPMKTLDICNLEMDTYNQFYQLFLIFVLIVSFAGNLTVVIVILMSRSLRNSVTNYFIVSLALSDIGVTIFLLPIKIDLASHNQAFCNSLSLCIFWNLTDVFFNVASVTNLLLITCDRFLAVITPFAYPSMVTKERGIIMVALLWIYSALWSSSSVLRWGKDTEFNIKVLKAPVPVCLNPNPIFFTVVYTVVFILPLILMGELYFVILKAAIKQARAITSLEVGNEKQKHKRLNKYRREIKATKTIAIVYGAFLFCWLPVCIISISGNWCVTCYLELREKNPTLHKFIYITFVEVLPPLNSAMNPFIYVMFGKQFRTGFKLLFYKLIGRSRGDRNLLDGITMFSRDRAGSVGFRRSGRPSVSEIS